MSDDSSGLRGLARQLLGRWRPAKAKLRAWRPDRATWEQGFTIVVGYGAALVVFLTLSSSPQTECYRDSLKISVAYSDASLPGCRVPVFNELRTQLAIQRVHLVEDGDFVPDEPEAAKGNAALVVWFSLFSATAAVAGISAVRSAYLVWLDLRQKWVLTVWAFVSSFLLTVAILAVPSFVLGFAGDPNLSRYDDLHMSEIRWLTKFILLLSLPAAMTLRIIGYILRHRSPKGLNDLARIGSQMRMLIGLLGGVVSLAVLGTAARLQAIEALPGGESLPSTVILLWGSVYAVVLAVIYVPVHERWASLAGDEIHNEVSLQFADVRTAGTLGFTVPELSASKELRTSIGLGGATASLQGSLSILAPVIAAAIASLFP